MSLPRILHNISENKKVKDDTFKPGHRVKRLGKKSENAWKQLCTVTDACGTYIRATYPNQASTIINERLTET